MLDWQRSGVKGVMICCGGYRWMDFNGILGGEKANCE